MHSLYSLLLDLSRIQSAITETGSAIGNGQPVTHPASTVNPIYEGPVYESPNGEPLRALLGSAPSTPNTPLDGPRYIFDSFAPSLPPPRKLSLLHDTPDALPTTVKMKGASKAPELMTEEDEYAVMRPTASVNPHEASKPSPLVIPTQLPALPEV